MEHTTDNRIVGLVSGGAVSDAKRKNPLHLAYVGDAVHSLYVRARLAESYDCTSGRLHALAVRHLSAQGQSAALASLMPGLSDEELRLVRRGRNARPANTPRHASASDYHSATAFEALIGFLYLSDSGPRLLELLDRAYTFSDAQRRAADAGC
ncbi:MAG: hypothetical protein GX549_07655 [Clostridiales bacterium]|nr:hypothetical protein [Clostridiales bacterium]